MSSADSPQILPNLDTSASGLAKDENSQKVKEREERLRIARERQKEEQRRKLEELREAMERAEEFRKKQEENRRQKIEELKRRDEQHRASVEERRKKLLDEENERKQAILRKTEAKLDQTKQKKFSGFYQFNYGSADERRMGGPDAEIKRKPLVTSGQLVGDLVVGRMSTSRRGSDHGQRRKFAERRCPGTSVALIAQSSSTLNVTQSSSLRAADFPSSRHLESIPYENNAPAAGKKTDLTVRKKRLSSSVDQIARIQATKSASQTNKQEVELSSAGSDINGSPSPVVNNRAKSTGNMRKSRADLRKTTEALQPAVNEKAASAEQDRNSTLIRTGISKSVSSTEALGVNATLKSARSPTIARASVQNTKFVKGPQIFSIPPAKLLPSPPKTLTIRSLPKTLKDTSSHRSLSSNKGVIKAVHDLDIQIQPLQLDRKKELPAGDASEKQKGVSAETYNKTGKNSVEEEYKVKLTEKRRLAREKAEQESEQERQRVEEERQKEEERQRLEEEQQRKHEEEELRAAEEARKQEEERFRLAVEEAERQRREEEEKQEAERQQKLAAEKRAQEEAERKEKERQEKLQREEEERQERKKKIETIMKRVKTDDASQKDGKESKAVEPAGGDESGFKFLSPLLKKLMGSKFRGKASSSESLPAALESSDDGSKTLKTEAPSKSIVAVETNLDDLLDEKPETPSPSFGFQSQPNVEEAANADSESLREAEPSVFTGESISSNEESGAHFTGESANSNEENGAHTNTSLTSSPSNEEAVFLSSQSNLEVIDLSLYDNKVTKASDGKQNWAVTAKQPSDPISTEKESLPDLPRIAFDDNTVKNSQNKLPDILM